MAQRRIRVLLLAKDCNPAAVSVALTGWGHTRALHDLVDLHVVTQASNREALEREDIPIDRFTFLENTGGRSISRGLARVFADAKHHHEQRAWTTLRVIGLPEYYLFEWFAWSKFAHRLTSGAFDLVHRLTPTSPVVPSYIAHRLRRIGVPFVVGPLNGGLPYPATMKARLWQERDLLWSVRPAYTLLPLMGSTRRDAAALLLGGRHVLTDLPQGVRDRCFYMPENGLFRSLGVTRREGPVTSPLQVATSGRLVPLKAFDLLLQAVAPLARGGRVHLHVVGDGSERARLETIARQERIAEAVTFHGWVEHDEVPRILGGCDVFAFPSIKEQGGAAVVEAMAIGLVPIVVRYGGPGEVVRDDFGYRVPMGDEASIVRGVHDALAHLVAHPETVMERRERARASAWGRFAWDHKARQTRSVYEWILGRGPRPQMDFPVV